MSSNSDESLRRKIQNMTNKDLLIMVGENSEDYTEEALLIAAKEIEKRNLIEKSIEDNDDNNRYWGENETLDIPKSSIASVIKFIGYLDLILGIIVGIYFVAEMNFSIGIAIVISGFASGILFIGFGEIIKLLNEINERYKTKKD